MTTKEIVKANNLQLAKKLIPKGDEPIYCNSVIDPNDEVFNQSFKPYEKA
jgi:hypothetical protein